MQNILFGGAQKAANGIVDEFSKRPSRALSLRVHNQKGEKKGKRKEKFTIKPELPLEQQFAQLQIYAQQHNRRRLQIKGFKGTFKIENWINIETKLRDMQGLKAIGFVDTQLDKVHLDVLCRWLSWVEPQKLIIELQQNELDNEDCADFLYFLFERNIDVRSIYIMGNPGIFKGVLLKELKEYLFKKFENNMIHYFKLIKNKQTLSVAIIRLLRRKNDELISKRVHRAEVKIDQTQYYKLQLKNCFTDIVGKHFIKYYFCIFFYFNYQIYDLLITKNHLSNCKNWKGFQDLIQTTYKEDNLEQLTYLDISNNFLGTQNAFNSMCTSISSAKGLLVLKLGNQPLIHNSQTIELLMGNRYDNLKLRELDISDNKDMLEKTFKALSDNIFKSCKIITFTGSMPQQLSTLFKMFVLTEAFADKTKESKQIYREKKQFRKDYLQILDLSSVENYNRHDLVEKLLLNTVFTEFTNIRTLHVQNFDVGRCQAYVKAKKKFLIYMDKKKQDDSFFKNYKHPLKHINGNLNKKRILFRIQFINIYQLYLFTEKGIFNQIHLYCSIVEIETIEIQESTFRQANRAEGLQEACVSVIENTTTKPDIRYSIKKISMNDGDYQMDFNTIKCYLCLPSVQLEELSYLNDSMTFSWSNLYQEMISYCSKLNADQFHSLKILKLQNISDISIDIYQFIELFIFNPKIQLKELLLIEIYTKNANENNKSLKNSVEKSEKVTLERLSLGEFYEGKGEDIILEQVVFNKKVNLRSLTLKNIKHLEYLDKIEKLISDENPLAFLTTFEIDNIHIEKKEDWKKVIQIFVINQRLTLQSFKIKDKFLNQQFSDALNQLLLPFEQELFNIITSKKEAAGMVRDLNDQNMLSSIQNESIGLPFSMTSLSFENCTIQDDVLSGFLVICELKNLSIINCKDFQIGIKKSMEIIKSLKLDQYYSFKIKSFSCERTIIKDVETFQSLIKEIALNVNRQLLENLNLDGCSLNDEMLLALSKQLLAIKEEQKLYNRVFLLRDLNLSIVLIKIIKSIIIIKCLQIHGNNFGMFY